MEKNIKIQVHDLNLFYGQNHALHNVSLDIKEKGVTALIGPSGCGKSTFLKCLNRMNDLVDNVRIEGEILLDGEDIYAPSVDTTVLRKKVGMVFQQPNPFPMSIYDNIAYGPRVHGIKDKRTLDQIVEESLKGAAIFDEVKDRLKKSALGLPGCAAVPPPPGCSAVCVLCSPADALPGCPAARAGCRRFLRS